MKKQIKWNSKENTTVLFTEIQKSPDNLQHAFRQIAGKLNVSTGAVRQAWYQKFRHNVPQFATGSKNSVVVNTKNVFKKDKSILNETNLIHEKVLSTENISGLKVVTLMKVYAS